MRADEHLGDTTRHAVDALGPSDIQGGDAIAAPSAPFSNPASTKVSAEAGEGAAPITSAAHARASTANTAQRVEPLLCCIFR